MSQRLAPAPLANEIDSMALVSLRSATDLLGYPGKPASIYVRSDLSQVDNVRAVLAPSANPASPESVNISRPSDILAAKSATDSSLNALILVLTAIALLVGGIGVANTMIVAVLERRSEIGLRRALGATKSLTEAGVLTVMGGAVGAALGVGAATFTAVNRSWPVTLPWPAVGASIVVTIVVGLIAGLYPAAKAARQQPTAALTGGD